MAGLSMHGVVNPPRLSESSGAPQEPISGILSGHPLIEAIFISGLYLLTGLGLILFPVALKWLSRRIGTAVGLLWAVPGVAIVAFGALNYLTHIGLIIHTT